MPGISVVINTLNEEDNIDSCLKTVVTFANEIILVDMHSDDKTVEIAKTFRAKIYLHDRVGFVEPARNFALSKATQPWILIIDADERIPTSLAKKIKEIVQNPQADVYYVPEKNLLFGRWIKHAIWWPDYHPRLFKKGALEWPSVIHSSPEVKGYTIHLEEKEEYAILHRPYESISEFLEMTNNYTDFEAEELHKSGLKFRRRHAIIHPIREFRRRYFTTHGYKDGFDGLVLSLLLAFYKLVAILKYWEKYERQEYRDKNQSKLKSVYRIMLDK